MAGAKINRIKTISEYHRLAGLPKPELPLISVVNIDDIKNVPISEEVNLTFDFYSISIKRIPLIKYKYGQQLYDFEEGVMFFTSPKQILGVELSKLSEKKRSGWIMHIHPDFFYNTSLAKTINRYEFFDYSVNEALHLSEKEENTINNIVKSIEQEYHSNIDNFSKEIIITHIENLLSYSNRFYNRQFITRKKMHHKILERLEKLLTDYFNRKDLVTRGLPSVQFISEELRVSQSYLGSLLRVLTGQNTQQHIHDKLIEKAKEKLSLKDSSISEIAYELGFEHSQSFSNLFKKKTNQSPMKFRQSFK
jgi:AraC family transcriptional activator of pobA